jgi:hypothetical protein
MLKRPCNPGITSKDLLPRVRRRRAGFYSSIMRDIIFSSIGRGFMYVF